MKNNIEEDLEWKRDPFKWRGFKFILYSYWTKRSSTPGTIYYRRTYFWNRLKWIQQKR